VSEPITGRVLTSVGDALLAVIGAMQQRGCRGCCTAEYQRDRAMVRKAVRLNDREALIRLAASYGLHHPADVTAPARLQSDDKAGSAS